VSLQQRVVFNGRLVAVSNAPGMSQNFMNVQQMPEQQLRSRVQNGAWFSNGRVIGRAVTADGQAVEVDAERQ
jgi:hypothetical protein